MQVFTKKGLYEVKGDCFSLMSEGELIKVKSEPKVDAEVKGFIHPLRLTKVKGENGKLIKLRS